VKNGDEKKQYFAISAYIETITLPRGQGERVK
jgi:hypothetical protein